MMLFVSSSVGQSAIINPIYFFFSILFKYSKFLLFISDAIFLGVKELLENINYWKKVKLKIVSVFI